MPLTPVLKIPRKLGLSPVVDIFFLLAHRAKDVEEVEERSASRVVKRSPPPPVKAKPVPRSSKRDEEEDDDEEDEKPAFSLFGFGTRKVSAPESGTGTSTNKRCGKTSSRNFLAAILDECSTIFGHPPIK